MDSDLILVLFLASCAFGAFIAFLLPCATAAWVLFKRPEPKPYRDLGYVGGFFLAFVLVLLGVSTHIGKRVLSAEHGFTPFNLAECFLPLVAGAFAGWRSNVIAAREKNSPYLKTVQKLRLVCLALFVFFVVAFVALGAISAIP